MIEPFYLISTHSLTKRLTDQKHRLRQVRFYFNSQPHEEADDYFVLTVIGVDISTHSLTKRLTELSQKTYLLTSISTHSLTKRLTA